MGERHCLDREFEVGVVGLGGLGAAAAYWLARQATTVVGFEQFELGHARGASHDHSRIIRRSYHTPGYVRLTAEAYEAWAAVEATAARSSSRRPVASTCSRPARRSTRPVPSESRRGRRRRTSGSTVPRCGGGGRRSGAAPPSTMTSWDLLADDRHRGGRSCDRDISSSGRSARRRAATEHARAPTAAVAAARSTSSPMAVPCAAERSSCAPTPGRTGCSTRSGTRIEFAVTREQVTYFPTDDIDDLRRAAFRCGSGWTTRATTGSRCSAWRERSRRPRTAAAPRSIPTPGRSIPTRRWRSGSAEFVSGAGRRPVGPRARRRACTR